MLGIAFLFKSIFLFETLQNKSVSKIRELCFETDLVHPVSNSYA